MGRWAPPKEKGKGEMSSCSSPFILYNNTDETVLNPILMRVITLLCIQLDFRDSMQLKAKWNLDFHFPDMEG